jgi:branched-chain amino acid transport system permease protein
VTLSYTLVHGTAGMFSVAHATFFGFGAYASALISINLPASMMLVAMLLAMLITALAALLVGLVALKGRGQAMMLITFSVQIVSTVVLVNTRAVGGEDGIPGVPEIGIGNLTLPAGLATSAFIWAVVGLLLVALRYLENTNWGRTIRAIREDEYAVEAAGVDVFHIKLATFVLAAAGAGLAGSMFAHTSSFVSPNSFSFDVTISIITMSVLGGQFSFVGAIVGAVVVTALPLLLAAIGIPVTQAAALIQLGLGLIIILTLYIRPTGLFAASVFQFPKSSAAPKTRTATEAEVA